MKNLIILLIAAIFCLTASGARASDADIAVALVKKAVTFYKANGAEKLIEEASNPNGQFAQGAFYVFVMDTNGLMLAHPANASLIGTSTIGLRDSDGKYFIKDMTVVAKEKGAGWADYKFKNPKTNEVADKSTYVERADDFVFGCGVYKR